MFADIPLPVWPPAPPDESTRVELDPQLVMLLPHPCQNYKGDVLRDVLVVAPVKKIPMRAGFASGGGDWGKFPLLGLADGVGMYCDEPTHKYQDRAVDSCR